MTNMHPSRSRWVGQNSGFSFFAVWTKFKKLHAGQIAVCNEVFVPEILPIEL